MELNLEIFKAELEAKPFFDKADEIALYNQEKVLRAFQNNRIAALHFNPSTGYGYDDPGRIALNKLYAEIFRTEEALVSPLIANATHAITLCLFGLLRPGDTLLSISGKPYDTLDEVISGQNNGSLRDFGIEYEQVDFLGGDFDESKIIEKLSNICPKVVFIQRSKGYLWQEASSICKLEHVITLTREASPSSIVMVDNCYGEFVEKKEPTEIGADLVVGSLIKNPGGGLAPTGGYICGKRHLIELISYRMTAPSLGNEVGSYFSGYLPLFQGLFLAPSTVKDAIKGNILAGFLFKNRGFDTIPATNVYPSDIIRAIKFNDKDLLIRFCKKIQSSSPIDSYVSPEPWDMPGYNEQVIMAAGTFIQGASLELTADAPIKPPYIGYLQGGLTYEHIKLALINILSSM